MDKIQALMTLLINDDDPDEAINPKALDILIDLCGWESDPVYRRRATDWKKSHGKFMNAFNLAYAKIFWILSEEKCFLKEDIKAWKMPEEEKTTIFHEIYKKIDASHGLLNELTAITEIQRDISKGIYYPQQILDFIPEVTESPIHSHHQSTEDITDEDISSFDFLRTKIPIGIFSSCLDKDFIKCCLKTKCIGKEADQLNDLPPESAWKRADKLYLIPAVLDRLSKFEGTSFEEDKESQILMYVKEILRKVSEPQIELPQVTYDPKIQSTLEEISNQLYSLGVVKPITEQARPIQTPPSTLSSTKSETTKTSGFVFKWD